MIKKSIIALSFATTLLLGGCASTPEGDGFVTLLDRGKGLENWEAIGDANWRVEDNLIVADKGKGGFLVSRQRYKDFIIRAEFWAATDTNSGIFVRLSNPKTVTADNSYEVNIWDIRPDPKYATGGIVNFATVPVPPIYFAGGKWNNMEIEAKGPMLSVKLNGITTATLNNDKFAEGPIALQFGAGVQGALGGPIKWRKVAIKPL
ncbi:MAG: DUF1080 domain-containing protein [Nitrosomonadaceae bacterium]|nr:DUF1080 domain-containing protein [Nitrosomonadaceae bacterium]